MIVEPKICENPVCKGRTFYREVGSEARECSKHDRVLREVPIFKVTPDKQWAKLSELIH